MNKKTKEYRKAIADAFVKSLTEDPQHWKQMWQGNMRPINGHTGRKYSGLNRFWLQHMMYEKNYDDPRFYTFKQVQDMGLKVKKGSKAVQVEFWSLYDPETKKTVSFSEAADYENAEQKLTILARYYSVFNGSQIEGLEKYEQPTLSDAAPQEVIDKIAQNMGVEILYDGGDSAYYHRLDDNIHLPQPQAFESQDAYNGTVLHELAHATGAEHRLNRTKGKYFGDEQYAREELVAEIASCFAQNDLGFTLEEDHFNNHKAYVQSWVSEIREKEEALMEAIKEAQRASDYILEMSEKEKILNSEEHVDYEKEASQRMRISYAPEQSFEEFVVQKGYSTSDLPQEDDIIKLVVGGMGGVTMRQESEVKKAAKRIALQNTLYGEYKELLNEGIIGKKEVQTKLDPEKESDRAYIRMKIKKEEAEKNITYEEEEKMSSERKTILIKVNKAFVEAGLQSKKDPERTYSKVTMPQNAVIGDQKIGGYSFYPTFTYDDMFTPNIVNIPWQSDTPVKMWKGDEEISVDPKELKEALVDSYHKWEKQIKEQKQKTAQKETEKHKGVKKENEAEME